jgi:ABC-type lipoprotein release transport system permease subunit
MLFNIAWRNVWRNKKRSAIVILAIAFGLWAGIFTIGFTFGMMKQMIESSIKTQLSHFQLHKIGFLAHRKIEMTMPQGEKIAEQLQNVKQVKALTKRSMIMGMASSPITASGVVIYGVDPYKEREITDICQQIRQGDYFASPKKNPIVIGQKLSESLEAKLGNKIVLTAQSIDGNISAGAFRVVGIYKTVSSMFDETTVFAQRDDLDRIFGLNGQFHEIAFILYDANQVDSLYYDLKDKFPGLQVDSWKQLAPELAYYVEIGAQTSYILMIIILLALVFGITNTMLMGVLERVRELGIIIALGMNQFRIFAMILLETTVLSLFGGTLGIVFGAITIEVFAKYGLDLSLFSEGLAAFGISNITYPFVPFSEYPKVVILVMLTAFISSIYPGIKAVRLNPIKAIRTY